MYKEIIRTVYKALAKILMLLKKNISIVDSVEDKCIQCIIHNTVHTCAKGSFI